MRRMNNLVTFFTAMTAFFFGCFLMTILISVDKCPTKKSGVAKLEPHPDLFLMTLIISAPHNFEKRRAIRETWLRLAQPLQKPYYPEEFIYLPEYDKRGHLRMEGVAEQENRMRLYIDWLDGLSHTDVTTRRSIKIKHFFAVGTQDLSSDLRNELEKEHKSYSDMLLLPRLRDIYSNLTEKVLHSLDALVNHYDFSYLLKVDDDSYVKLDYLLNEIISYDRKLTRKSSEYRDQPLPQLYWGYFSGRHTVKSKGQWSESNYFLASRYISYAMGGGYVISRKICELVSNNSHYLSTYISEDVSMGTWLAPFRYVYRRHDPRFDTEFLPRKCRRYHLVLHKRNETLMRHLYENKLCTFEISGETRLKRPVEYYYDWRKPAEKCCDTIVI